MRRVCLKRALRCLEDETGVPQKSAALPRRRDGCASRARCVASRMRRVCLKRALRCLADETGVRQKSAALRRGRDEGASKAGSVASRSRRTASKAGSVASKSGLCDANPPPVGSPLPHDDPALHHEHNPLQRLDILQRIAVDGDDVGELPRFEHAGIDAEE